MSTVIEQPIIWLKSVLEFEQSVEQNHCYSKIDLATSVKTSPGLWMKYENSESKNNYFKFDTSTESTKTLGRQDTNKCQEHKAKSLEA